MRLTSGDMADTGGEPIYTTLQALQASCLARGFGEKVFCAVAVDTVRKIRVVDLFSPAASVRLYVAVCLF